MTRLISFSEAISLSKEYNKRHLLMGNGFSIACRPSIFLYNKLFDQADFSALSPAVRQLFEVLGTVDFEKVIKLLRDAEKIVSLYGSGLEGMKERMIEDADGLRELLVRTIAASHPERPSDISNSEYVCCREFLSNFDSKYTLNYDLLLYWVIMHLDEGEDPSSKDGFRKPDYNYSADYVVWESDQSHDQDVWYLHGALHVFDSGVEVQKYTWCNTGIRLIEQIRDALYRNYFPLFVAEGSSAEKLERIRHSDYLAKAKRSFENIQGSLFVFGHSFADNDEHILRIIERGKIKHLFVGIHGDASTPANKYIIHRSRHMMYTRTERKPLDVTFYASESAHVWS